MSDLSCVVVVSEGPVQVGEAWPGAAESGAGRVLEGGPGGGYGPQWRRYSKSPWGERGWASS